MIPPLRALVVLTPLAALTVVGLTAPTASADTTQTSSCRDGGGTLWRAQAAWGAEYTVNGVTKVRNDVTGFTSASPAATTVDYSIRMYAGTGVLVSRQSEADRAFDFAGGTAYLNRNPVNPPSSPGHVKVVVNVGDGNDGFGNCTMTFTQPAGSTPSPSATPTASASTGNHSAPASGGYFQLAAAGAALPSDAECATRVHRSTWEPRPENITANRTHPPVGYVVNGYGGMSHPDQTWGRVTGQANGTTDELLQHYACKWGLPDDVMRAEAVTESTWYQNLKDANGNPVSNKGYGDYGSCSGGPYGSSGPASLGLMQIKHCAHPGTLPYSETSTAFNLDYYGALIRGCVNGWDYVTSSTGDLWGCVGRWYSGDWYDSGAQDYIANVRGNLNDKPWLRWAG